MSNNSNSTSGGISFLGLLAIVFIVLKLCKVIAWSWWWVLSPLWGPASVLGIRLCMVCLWAFIRVRLFSSPEHKEQMERIKAEEKRNAGKSKWQIRMEEMQKTQKLRENK